MRDKKVPEIGSEIDAVSNVVVLCGSDSDCDSKTFAHILQGQFLQMRRLGKIVPDEAE